MIIFNILDGMLTGAVALGHLGTAISMDSVIVGALKIACPTFQGFLVWPWLCAMVNAWCSAERAVVLEVCSAVDLCVWAGGGALGCRNTLGAQTCHIHSL